MSGELDYGLWQYLAKVFCSYLSASSYLLWVALLTLILIRPALSYVEAFWLRKWVRASRGSFSGVDLSTYPGLNQGESSDEEDYWLLGFGLIGELRERLLTPSRSSELRVTGLSYVVVLVMYTVVFYSASLRASK